MHAMQSRLESFILELYKYVGKFCNSPRAKFDLCGHLPERFLQNLVLILEHLRRTLVQLAVTGSVIKYSFKILLKGFLYKFLKSFEMSVGSCI